MNLEDQVRAIVENTVAVGELVEGISTVEQNTTDFVRWCDAMGIQSQPDDSERA